MRGSMTFSRLPQPGTILLQTLDISILCHALRTVLQNSHEEQPYILAFLALVSIAVEIESDTGFARKRFRFRFEKAIGVSGIAADRTLIVENNHRRVFVNMKSPREFSERSNFTHAKRCRNTVGIGSREPSWMTIVSRPHSSFQYLLMAENIGK
jgi:hypothetical protein